MMHHLARKGGAPQNSRTVTGDFVRTHSLRGFSYGAIVELRLENHKGMVFGVSFHKWHSNCTLAVFHFSSPVA